MIDSNPIFQQIYLADCHCGFSAGEVNHCGERWEIRCTRSTCFEMAWGKSRSDAILEWNVMQSKKMKK